MKTYTEMLKMPEWRRRRQQVFERAGYRCEECGQCEPGCQRCDFHAEEGLPLQVHHKYYQRGRKPWEYPDEALAALCRRCHEERTAQNDVLHVAMGLLCHDNAEKLLQYAKRLLNAQQRDECRPPMPKIDYPGELELFLRPGIDPDLAALMAD